jgi:hypothetical protein
MKGHILWIVALCTVVLLASFQFLVPSPLDFTIVQLQGVSGVWNYSHLGMGFFGERQGKPPLTPVWDDDILFLEADKAEFISTYSRKDGQALSFEKRNSVLYQAGKPVSLAWDEETPEQAWEWLSTAKTSDLRSLRFLVLENIKIEDIDSSRLALLQKVAQTNPHIGLLLNAEQVQALLPLFQPALLMLGLERPLSAEAIKEAIKIMQQQRTLRTLWISLGKTDDFADLKFLSGLSSIERLTLSTNNALTFPSDKDFFPRNLRSLSLSGFSIEDLSFLKRLDHLKELSLESCEVKDATVLAELTRLTALDLAGCEGIADPAVLNHMPGLRYVVTPQVKDQKALISSLQTLNHLQMLHVGYPQLSNVAGLQDIRSLRGLIISGKPEKEMPFQSQSLYGMKQLRYLALGKDLVTDPKEMEMLEKALPDCRIAIVEGVCMGSGWIILLVPAVLVAMLAVSQRRRQGKSGTGHVLTL